MQVGIQFLFHVTGFLWETLKAVISILLSYGVRKIKIHAGLGRQTATAGYLWHTLHTFRQSITLLCCVKSFFIKKTLKILKIRTDWKCLSTTCHGIGSFKSFYIFNYLRVLLSDIANSSTIHCQVHSLPSLTLFRIKTPSQSCTQFLKLMLNLQDILEIWFPGSWTPVFAIFMEVLE